MDNYESENTVDMLDMAANKIILKAAKSDYNLLDIDAEHEIVEDAMESAMSLSGFGVGTDQEVGYPYLAEAALAVAKAYAVRVDSDLEVGG